MDIYRHNQCRDPIYNASAARYYDLTEAEIASMLEVLRRKGVSRQSDGERDGGVST